MNEIFLLQKLNVYTLNISVNDEIESVDGSERE